jgi:hypothetical protein
MPRSTSLIAVVLAAMHEMRHKRSDHGMADTGMHD